MNFTNLFHFLHFDEGNRKNLRFETMFALWLNASTNEWINFSFSIQPQHTISASMAWHIYILWIRKIYKLFINVKIWTTPIDENSCRNLRDSPIWLCSTCDRGVRVNDVHESIFMLKKIHRNNSQSILRSFLLKFVSNVIIELRRNSFHLCRPFFLFRHSEIFACTRNSRQTFS